MQSNERSSQSKSAALDVLVVGVLVVVVVELIAVCLAHRWRQLLTNMTKHRLPPASHKLATMHVMYMSCDQAHMFSDSNFPSFSLSALLHTRFQWNPVLRIAF